MTMQSNTTIAAFILALAVAVWPATGHAEEAVPQTGTPAIAFVFDASGSMNAKLADGQTRLEAAKAAVAQAVDTVPADTMVGLRVYGHQSKPSAKNCEDSELVVPFGLASQRASEIKTRISGLNALGYTPINLSLQKAAADLGAAGAGKKTIILVSDGKETCNADPCALAQSLANADATLVIHTVGFGVDDAARSQLQCIANVARGTFYDAKTMIDLSGKLSEAVRTTAKAPPPPERKKLDASGTLTVKGLQEAGLRVTASTSNELAGVVEGGKSLELPPGIYGVDFSNGRWTGIGVNAGHGTVVEPAYLSNKNDAKDVLELIDIETAEKTGDYYDDGTAMALLPGRFRLRSLAGFELGEVELKSGQTAAINPAILRITGGKENTAYAITSEGAGSGVAIVRQNIQVAAGRYTISDPDDPSVAPVVVDVKDGETREIEMARK